MSETAPLAKQAQLMESYGAHCVYVTDSGGALTMDGYAARIKAYSQVLKTDIQIGVRAHHKLSLGIANSVVVVQNGATRVDALPAGMVAYSSFLQHAEKAAEDFNLYKRAIWSNSGAAKWSVGRRT
jgi:4-hydroxy 2-oxovalerate aldolase